MRLTFEQAHFMQPTWTDADLITFDFGPTNLTSLDPSSKQANGMGDLLQLTKGSSWRLSMRGPVLMQCDQGIANCDIARLPGTTNGQVELILNDAHNEMMPDISRTVAGLPISRMNPVVRNSMSDLILISIRASGRYLWRELVHLAGLPTGARYTLSTSSKK